MDRGGPRLPCGIITVELRPIIAIFGPTASGKSAIAIALACRLEAEGTPTTIVSADSIAVYRELPILSGAPTAAERRGIRHLMIGIRSVTEGFSAGEYAGEVHPLIDSEIHGGRQVLIVGGTGLYMRAATAGLAFRSPVPDSVRAHLADRLAREGSEALHRELLDRDPGAAVAIVPTDGRRVTRALELLEVGMRPHDDSSGLWRAPPRHPTVTLGITRDPADLRARIERRTSGMFAAGLEAEVRAAEALDPSPVARAAIGWEEALAGDRDRLVTRTWQFGRRQRTWMRRMPGLIEVPTRGDDPESTSSDVARLLSALPADLHGLP